MPPGMPPGPGFPPGMPPFGMGPGPMDPKLPTTAASHIDLGMLGRELLIAIDLTWSEPVNRTVIGPRMMGIANQIKGKMAIFTSEYSWHALAAAGPKALADPERKMFPRGTWDRKSNSERFGLEYPPVQRVSLFVDLLPYLGRGQLGSTVNKNLAWYDERNLEAAGAWVPELLVPDYPQSAWRATSPFAPDHVLGATNYVAIAGVGLDIARVNPNDPAFKTKVGITGYGWGSKAEEVTDGLSNTIYLMQTPPGLQQPWIAGGGATVRGLDETNPMGAFKYTQRGQTKQGTYVLMGDGSARFISEDIDPKVLRAMATRAGDDNKDLADIDKVAPRVEPPKGTTELKTDPKPADKKPEEKKPADPKVDPKAVDPKKEPTPGGKADPAPPPGEKK